MSIKNLFQALHHFKYCELRKEVEEVYFPAISFKSNFNWLQTNNKFKCLIGSNIDKESEELKGYLWKQGPVIWPLKVVVIEKSTLRYEHDEKLCLHHMGLGAAIHMSSVSDPAEYLCKLSSVLEPSTDIPKELIKLIAEKKLNLKSLIELTFLPWCHRNHAAVHVRRLRHDSSRLLVLQSIPWIVREYPLRYPFLLPTQINSYYSTYPNDHDNQTTEFQKLSSFYHRNSSSYKENFILKNSSWLRESGMSEWIRQCPPMK